MKKTFFLFVILFSTKSFAQEQYKFSNDIENDIQNDKNGDDYRYQVGAMKYSVSNYYIKGLQTWDKLGRKRKKNI
ncbi:hypothetical protein [Chryseobacterium proteolyticum]|uniref:hypothetical protein n=1 Tax=Chryseobacterium proteolyticum TaxID=118127 RepID=UPI0039836161